MKKTIIPILVFFLAVVCMAYRLKEQDKKLKEKMPETTILIEKIFLQ